MESEQAIPCGLNEGHVSKFCVGSQVQQEIPEESQRTHQPKREYNNKDERLHTHILITPKHT